MDIRLGVRYDRDNILLQNQFRLLHGLWSAYHLYFDRKTGVSAENGKIMIQRCCERYLIVVRVIAREQTHHSNMSFSSGCAWYLSEGSIVNSLISAWILRSAGDFDILSCKKLDWVKIGITWFAFMFPVRWNFLFNPALRWMLPKLYRVLFCG